MALGPSVGAVKLESPIFHLFISRLLPLRFPPSFYPPSYCVLQGRIVSAAQAGGVASQRSTFINGAITYAASNSIDLIADPWGANALGTNGLSHSVCPSNFGVREFWTNNYAPVAPVSQAIFVNRMDSGLGVRIAQGEGVLSVVAHNGTTVGRLSLGATAWQTLSLAPFLPPATPDASSPEQQSEANRVNGVRFVTVTIPANLRLNFREWRGCNTCGNPCEGSIPIRLS